MARTATAPAPITQLRPDRAAWDREVAAYLGEAANGSKSPNTVRSYGNALGAWATWRQDQGLSLDPIDATRREAQDWVAHMRRTLSPGTGATRAAALVTFFRWMVREWAIGGDVRQSPFYEVTAPKAVPPRVAVLTDTQVDRLLAACEGTTFADLRDRAILTLTLSAGLRRSEVAALLVEDVDPVARLVRVQEGKGDQDAVVPFGQVAADALRHYLRARDRHRDAQVEAVVGVRSHRQRWGQPLFLVDVASGRRGGLSAHTVANILERRAEAAGLGHVHPHQLRHTFAHKLLEDGVQEGSVMALGRWKSRKVMDRYGADLRAQRAAMAYRDPLARGRARRG